MMKDLLENGILFRVVLLGILTALLGIVPISKTVTAGFEAVHRNQDLHNSESVATHLATLAEQQPWRSGLWEAAGNVALAAGDVRTASVYYARAASKGELSPEGFLAWGDADLQAENPRTAIQIWEIAKRYGVSPYETLTRQANAYRILNDHLALIDALQSILVQPTAQINQQFAVSALNRDLGLLLAAYDPGSAPTYLSKAMEYEPGLELQIRDLDSDIKHALSYNDPVYLLTISGRRLANMGYWHLAEKAFKNAIQNNPNYAEAWAYLGEAQQHLTSAEDPLVALKTALELNPSSISANTFQALYWQRQEKYETALEYYQTAASLDPENPSYLVEIGNLQALLGDLAQGQNYYMQAIAQSSNDPSYVREFLRFCIQYNLNLGEVALPVARQLVLLDPKNPASLDVMGEILFRLGDMLNAERFFFRALEHDSEYDQAHLHLGDLYRSQGNNSLARYHYARVLELSTNEQTLARVQNALSSIIFP